MKAEIGTEADMALVDPIIDLLDKAEPVAQQKAIEILMARHARLAATYPPRRAFVLNAMVKHALQILEELGL